MRQRACGTAPPPPAPVRHRAADSAISTPLHLHMTPPLGAPLAGAYRGQTAMVLPRHVTLAGRGAHAGGRGACAALSSGSGSSAAAQSAAAAPWSRRRELRRPPRPRARARSSTPTSTARWTPPGAHSPATGASHSVLAGDHTSNPFTCFYITQYPSLHGAKCFLTRPSTALWTI